MGIVLTTQDDNNYLKFSYQVDELRESKSKYLKSQMRAALGDDADADTIGNAIGGLGYVEYLCWNTYGQRDTRKALEEFNALPEKIRNSSTGQRVLEFVKEQMFYDKARCVMWANVETGKCKMSHSGKVVIFSNPVVCDRYDLCTSRPDTAKAQFIANGIEPFWEKCNDSERQQGRHEQTGSPVCSGRK